LLYLRYIFLALGRGDWLKTPYGVWLKTTEYRHMGKEYKIAQKFVIWYLNVP